MSSEVAFTLTSRKPFAEVVANLEKHAPEHQFRVLHVHDVQGTLAEKGFRRDALKIIEVCNSSFAFNALQKAIDVALFMPCKFAVHTEGDKTVVSLGLPSMINELMPQAGLKDLADEVEKTLKKVMEESV